MPPCAEAGCPSLATNGDRCAVHASYRQARKDEEIRCALCKWKLRVDQWYRIVNGQNQHVGACPTREGASA